MNQLIIITKFKVFINYLLIYKIDVKTNCNILYIHCSCKGLIDIIYRKLLNIIDFMNIM